MLKKVSFALVGALFLVVPLAASAQGACPSLYRTLSYGMRGADVTQLQQSLIAQGFLGAGNATGYFGPLTEAAVQKFQSASGVVSSGTPTTTGYGVVGPKTRAAIAARCSGGTPPSLPPAQCPYFGLPIPGNACPSGSFWGPMRDVQGCQVGWQCTSGYAPPPPSQVSFFASPASGEVPLEVRFSGTVPDSGTYYINFDDGDSERVDLNCGGYGSCTFSGERHTYTEADEYTARLQRAVPSCSTCNDLRGRQTLQSLSIDVTEEEGTPSISITAPSSGKTVERGDVMTVSWDSDFAPDESKVRLEVYLASVSPTMENNDKGLASDSSELSRDGSYNWTIPPSSLTGPCIVDAGYTSCLAAGAYKIVAKLYTGGTCWGFCAGGTERTIHATAISPIFTISDATSSPFSASPASGAAPLTVTFSWSGASGAVGFDFGNGSQGVCSDSCSSGTINHTYTTVGIYTAKLKSGVTVLGTVTITVGGGGACVAPTHEMGVGATDATTGGDVTRLQQFLKRDPAIYPEGLVTGYFGHATERAVKRFQASKDIPETGYVGPLTLGAIFDACGGVSSTPYAFGASPRSGAAPLIVNFSAKAASSTDDNTWYSVDFGDGMEEIMSSDVGDGTLRLSHTYQYGGTYTAILVENESLCGLVGENVYGCTRSLEVDDATVVVSGASFPCVAGQAPDTNGRCYQTPQPTPSPWCNTFGASGYPSDRAENTQQCPFTCPTGFQLVGKGYCAPSGGLQGGGTISPAPGQCYQGQVLIGGQCLDTCNPGTIYSGGQCLTPAQYSSPPPIPWWYNSAGGASALSALESSLKGLVEWLGKQPQ